MKSLFYFLAVLLFISSCSKTDHSIFPDDMNDDEVNNDVEDIIPLKLETKEAQHRRISLSMQYSNYMIVYSDTTEIVNPKDFLCYNWEER